MDSVPKIFMRATSNLKKSVLIKHVCVWNAAYIFAKVWYAQQRAVYIYETVEHTSKLWVVAQDIPISFFFEVAFIDENLPQRSSLFTH